MVTAGDLCPQRIPDGAAHQPVDHDRSVWLPLMFYLLVRAFQKRSVTYAILCGGPSRSRRWDPTPSPFSIPCSHWVPTRFWLFGVWRDRESTPGKEEFGTAPDLADGCSGVGGAFHSPPSRLFLPGSSRACHPGPPLSYEAITSYSLPPYNLLTFLFPNILGNPVIGYVGEETFEELHAYIGILPLMLVYGLGPGKSETATSPFSRSWQAWRCCSPWDATRCLSPPGVRAWFDFFRAPARWLFIAPSRCRSWPAMALMG